MGKIQGAIHFQSNFSLAMKPVKLKIFPEEYHGNFHLMYITIYFSDS